MVDEMAQPRMPVRMASRRQTPRSLHVAQKGEYALSLDQKTALISFGLRATCCLFHQLYFNCMIGPPHARTYYLLQVDVCSM
jgi:hypothetical protein